MDELDALYELAPEEFVAARTALAKRLRTDGRREEAAEVAARRRPTPAAWALNQVARHDPSLIAAALDAGRALRAAADEAMAGDASELKRATATERAAASAVIASAGTYLGARLEPQRAALAATLRVAALDADVADLLERGVLTTDLEQPGFGFGDVEAGPPARPRRPRATARPRLEAVPTPEPVADDRAAAKAEAAAERAAVRARRKERAAAERTAARLAREAVRLSKEADDADEAARGARAAAVAATERADQAADAVRALVDDP